MSPKAGHLLKEQRGDGVGKGCGVKDVALGVGETDRHLVGVGHDDFTGRSEGLGIPEGDEVYKPLRLFVHA
jgi:hypothetical protein